VQKRRMNLRGQQNRKRIGRHAAAAHSAPNCIKVSELTQTRASKQYSFKNGPGMIVWAAMIRVVAAIIERDSRLLICQRRAGTIFGGKWEFPGGKVRPSELPRQAMARELREELGVTPEVGGLMQVVRHRYAEMANTVEILFFGAELYGFPRNLAFERMLWAKRDELPQYDFLAADRHVISRLVRREI
jgi:8-oxo-dGTP diphosphatase